MYKEIIAFKHQGLNQCEIAGRLGADSQDGAQVLSHERDRIPVLPEPPCASGHEVLSRTARRLSRCSAAPTERTVYVSSIYDVLEERHGKLPGTLRTLSNYVTALRSGGELPEQPQRMTLPVAAQPAGKQMQMDFGVTRLELGRKAYIYAAVLSHSRARYAAVQDHPFTTLEVISHTLDAFAYYGGRPAQLVIDQDRLMVVSENAGDIIYTRDFGVFLAEQRARDVGMP